MSYRTNCGIMREVFKGWRSKIGIITIVMALFFVGVWIRSYSVSEEIVVLMSGRLHAFMSTGGSFSWVSSTGDRMPDSFEWEMNSQWPNGRTSSSRSIGMLSKIKNFQWSDTVWETTADKSRFWIIHYWQIAVPLTLLSAYLLLIKPRSSKSEFQ